MESVSASTVWCGFANVGVPVTAALVAEGIEGGVGTGGTGLPDGAQFYGYFGRCDGGASWLLKVVLLLKRRVRVSTFRRMCGRFCGGVEADVLTLEVKPRQEGVRDFVGRVIVE